MLRERELLRERERDMARDELDAVDRVERPRVGEPRQRRRYRSLPGSPCAGSGADGAVLGRARRRGRGCCGADRGAATDVGGRRGFRFGGRREVCGAARGNASSDVAIAIVSE